MRHGGTHADRIIALLARTPGLDDDQIAAALSIEPRQSVNQVCRRLAANGVLTRERGPTGKIINALCKEAAVPASARAPDTRKHESVISSSPGSAEASGLSLVPADPARTLLIVPCSKGKAKTQSAGRAAIPSCGICRMTSPGNSPKRAAAFMRKFRLMRARSWPRGIAITEHCIVSRARPWVISPRPDITSLF